VIELYCGAQGFARSRIDAAPILMLGQEVFLRPSCFLIRDGQIHVLSAQRLAPINFAGCWNCNSRPPNYVDVDVSIAVLQPLVPPILWTATESSHHLAFDFFRNAWAVSHRAYDVPVPLIRRRDPSAVSGYEEPWLDAATRADPARDAPPLEKRVWWAGLYPSSIVREVFRGQKD
jgi:hypothetical protein